MNYLILLKCFGIGLLASCSFGPIFVLTFNRGAIYGFARGFATALGACVADGIYFFLGLVGVLAILHESHRFMFLLDTSGGFLLISLGIISLKKAFASDYVVNLDKKRSVFVTIIRSFLITILNPMVLFFFMLIGVQALPKELSSLPINQVFLCSLMVLLGSLTVLTTVSFISSHVGNSLNKKSLRIVSLLSGLIFIGVGIYFLDHLIINVLKMYNSL